MKNEQYIVKGMTCSACSAHVEKAVRDVQGVQSVSVNLLLLYCCKIALQKVVLTLIVFMASYTLTVTLTVMYSVLIIRTRLTTKKTRRKIKLYAETYT